MCLCKRVSHSTCWACVYTCLASLLKCDLRVNGGMFVLKMKLAFDVVSYVAERTAGKTMVWYTTEEASDRNW